MARIAKFVDQKSCEWADLILLDTDAHIDYFVREFSVDRKKIRKFIASCGESRHISKMDSKEKSLVILHYGEFQSLHGVEYIIQAAKLVPDARFKIIGKGQLLKRCLQLAQELKLKNLEFVPYLPYQQLLNQIAQADICLGLFGGTPKADMVIPNKVYDYLSMGKATITQNSSAIKELFADGLDLMLCPSRDHISLAQCIQRLMHDPILRKSLAKNGRETFEQKCSFPVLTKTLQEILASLEAA